MPKVDLFAEDQAHELFVTALVRRVFAEEQRGVELSVRCALGGHGRAISELKTYQRAIEKGNIGLARPDLVVVAIDANCKGWANARSSVLGAVDTSAAWEVVVACPDPHVERWFFADPQAFHRVLGVDQPLGKRKCERDIYKTLLKTAVVRAGHFPLLGGLEFAQDLVREMDLYRAGTNEPSLGELVNGVRAFARRSAV